MKRELIIFIFIIGFVFTLNLDCSAREGESSEGVIHELKQELQELRRQMEAQKQAYEVQMKSMQEKINAVSTQLLKEASETSEDELEAEIARSQVPVPSDSPGNILQKIKGGVQSLNPDISVIVDTYYHNSDAPHDSVGEVLGEISGFGDGHGHDHDHGHDHAALEEGFNMRHLELYFSGEVDPYFRAHAIAAISEDGAEMEEAVIQTTGLPAGLKLQVGKFFSHFGRINPQHSHEWDFVDQPLIYRLTLGEHGLNEKGAQLSWLAPAPFHLLAGVEAFQGDNELLFSHIGGDELPDDDGPRLWVGWLKFSPNLPQKHGLQLGVFGARGVHQEAHDDLDNTTMLPGDDGEEDHWLDGHSTFLGADMVYKYKSNKKHGHGDFVIQGEYMRRKKDLVLYDHINPAAPVGEDRIDKQDGYYVQALYGFLPRWRTGLRWEQVGLTNKSEFPDGTSESHDDSTRMSGMLDYSPTEFSRLRLQLNQCKYETEDGEEDFWQAYIQFIISLGTHGAHKF